MRNRILIVILGSVLCLANATVNAADVVFGNCVNKNVPYYMSLAGPNGIYYVTYGSAVSPGGVCIMATYGTDAVSRMNDIKLVIANSIASKSFVAAWAESPENKITIKMFAQ